MASFNIKIIKLPESETARGWFWVIVFGVLLTTIALIDRGGLRSTDTRTDARTGCQLTVASDMVNVRTAADPTAPVVAKLVKDDQVDGTTVLSNGFRQLADGNWVAGVNVLPVAGTACY